MALTLPWRVYSHCHPGCSNTAGTTTGPQSPERQVCPPALPSHWTCCPQHRVGPQAPAWAPPRHYSMAQHTGARPYHMELGTGHFKQSNVRRDRAMGGSKLSPKH